MVEYPIRELAKLKGSRVVVRLKSNLEFRGRLSDSDPQMNLILEDCQEYVLREGEYKLTKGLGTVFLRGNNVLFIQFE